MQEIGVGLAELAPWGALEFIDEVRELDLALDDGEEDPWMTR